LASGAARMKLLSVTVLELEPQLIMLATKPTKKHEILFFFVQFRGFRGHQDLIKEIKFLYGSDWPFFWSAAPLVSEWLISYSIA